MEILFIIRDSTREPGTFPLSEVFGLSGFLSVGEFFLSGTGLQVPLQGAYYSCNEGNYGQWSDSKKKWVGYRSIVRKIGYLAECCSSFLLGNGFTNSRSNTSLMRIIAIFRTVDWTLGVECPLWIFDIRRKRKTRKSREEIRIINKNDQGVRLVSGRLHPPLVVNRTQPGSIFSASFVV